jgi:hypothetical protein
MTSAFTADGDASTGPSLGFYEWTGRHLPREQRKLRRLGFEPSEQLGNPHVADGASITG